MFIKKGEYPLPANKIAHALIDHDSQVRGEVRLDHGRMAILIRMPGKEQRIKIWTKPPQQGNAIKLSKILIAHASNSVCFFHALSLPVNNKIKKLVE